MGQYCAACSLRKETHLHGALLRALSQHQAEQWSELVRREHAITEALLAEQAEQKAALLAVEEAEFSKLTQRRAESQERLSKEAQLMMEVSGLCASSNATWSILTSTV
ncbi:unnamed protein product [Protopolystoma xenopodis]|uniref:Uncharacterized protein n=1 Tax=Protopolystoma xenopodis TaxID=117903 RepID=A0A3S5CNN8_9PLAT|nr:unnamed protein product [Protopolystoma xenopodis]